MILENIMLRNNSDMKKKYCKIYLHEISRLGKFIKTKKWVGGQQGLVEEGIF